jgi:hypothetical protein
MNCRSCSYVIAEQPVIDLGNQYLSDFRSDDSKPARFPLAVLLCPHCGLAQLNDTVPREVLYTDSYGFRSGVNENNRANLQQIVNDARKAHPFARSWLDIACNDGTLLSFVPKHVHRVGVDPVDKFAAEAGQHANSIISDFFDPRLTGGPYDIITSISMFYDIDDLPQFVENVKSILASSGVWVVQQNYAPHMLDQDAVDNICHEHLTYFTLASLEHLLHRHGLEVLDVKFSAVNGGCIRTVIGHMGEHPIQPSVSRARMVEPRLDAADWLSFAGRVSFKLDRLRRLVRGMAENGQHVFAYGASTRGAVILQAAGLTLSEIPWAVERQPSKVGMMWSSVGIPIISEDKMRQWQPDALLCLPYWNRDQFVQREADYLAAGGKLIFPLPEIEEVTR